MTRVQTKERKPDLFGAAPTMAAPAKPPAKVKAVAQPKNEVAKIKPLKPPASVLEIIARIAADPNIDTDKMRAVIEIQRDTESNSSSMTQWSRWTTSSLGSIRMARSRSGAVRRRFFRVL